MFEITTEKLPIKIWSEDQPEENVMVQARNLANHPIARRHICLMPDYHLGYGMPIGGVLATQGGVVPNAVGVDIGCGMIAAKLSLSGEISKAALEEIRQNIHRRVPVGNGPQGNHDPDLITQEVVPIPDEVRWFLNGDREKEQRAWSQAGTLGGGNHFIELQRDEQEVATIWLMLHSGSRATGKKTCDKFHAIAMEFTAGDVPDKDLAYIPEGVPEYEQYIDAMEACMKYAEWNRAIMLKQSLRAIEQVLGYFTVEQQIETHHNFAAREIHFGEEYIVHRKGAVKAEGLVTIPGSMGTASYIGNGLRPTDSFNTCSHGAGRVLGRKQANRQITHEEAIASMSHVVFGVRQGDYDETPMAYKDIEQVMLNQRDLVEPVVRLLPLMVVKG